MIRVHLIQMFYNLSYYDIGYDLLEESAPLFDSVYALGHLRQIDPVSNLLSAQKASYIEQLSNKVESILHWSCGRKANIIVFPEYSIPADVLPNILQSCKKYPRIIIAGTHRVRLTEHSKAIYRAIGLNLDEKYNGTAVSPIFLPNGKVQCAFKQSKSKWEPNLAVPTQAESSVFQSELLGTQVRFAVAPCIDCLQMTTLAPFWSQRATKPNLVVCPSISPSVDLFNSLGNNLAANEVLFAYCNSALFGGTQYNIQNDWIKYLPGDQIHNTPVSKNRESILELDVNLDSYCFKKGTVITETPCRSPREFFITYPNNNRWLGYYKSLSKEILEALNQAMPSDAIEWIDTALSEQSVDLPEHIISRLKEVRHRYLPLFSGDIDVIRENLDLAIMGENIIAPNNYFAQRISDAITLATGLIPTVKDTKSTDLLLSSIKVLKEQESLFVADINQTKEVGGIPIDLEARLSQFRYVPSESLLASFQDRGTEQNDFRETIARASEKVIAVTGMPGIGKTEVMRTVFLKQLTDWTPIWINVSEGSSVSRMVAEIGNKFGIAMDPDSLDTVTIGVFRQKLSKIFDAFFELQCHALVIDDLMSLRLNSRDYHQLLTLIEEATTYKKFKGSRIFLLSSVSSPLLQRAGVAHVHLRGIEERHIRRVIEYQLRAARTLKGETLPDIPQKLLDFIGGHPLAAKLIAEASKGNLVKLAQDADLVGNVPKIKDCVLPKIELESDQEKALQQLAVFRIPIKDKYITNILDETLIQKLVSKALVDFDGSTYSVHPIIRDYYYKQIPNHTRIIMHRIAVNYYDSTAGRLRPGFDNTSFYELIHHLALCGDLKRLADISAHNFDELFSSARALYSEGDYEKALQLFVTLSEMRPKEPSVWACIGRCYGRKYQWTDCDESFQKAITIAEHLKQSTWWIHRDWGHIVLRYKSATEAQQHLDESKKSGGKDNPSVIASEAFIAWQDNVAEGKRLFESALRIDPHHGYTLNTYQKLLRKLGDKESLRRADELINTLTEIEGQMIAKPIFDMDMVEDDDL
ncbi:MAG: hypothetical protein JW856_05615 [Dehalococcoidales bacterium]|nr:hypothetical protein [Dehalococcoidales bacterium]